MGGLGGGHYTAYAKNAFDKEWYEFDDSSCSKIRQAHVEKEVVSSAAYNLFYRRRDWHERNMEQGVDFDALAIAPDMECLEKSKN